MKYLVMPTEDACPELMMITEADTPIEAIYAYGLELGIYEQWFLDDVYEHSVNMSFAERFFLQTDENAAYFHKHGHIKIDDEEFARRARLYFGEREGWYFLFMDFWNDHETPRKLLSEKHPFPTAMLAFMYMHPADDGDLIAVPTTDLERPKR